MKAERRHALQQNVLDAELGKVVEFFRRHGKYVAWGVFALALVLFVWLYARSSAQAKERTRQDLFHRMVINLEISEETLAALEEIADQDPNKFRAATACVTVADYCLQSVVKGGAAMSSEERIKRIQKAEAWYDRTVRDFSGYPGAVARAHLGLAAIQEIRRGLPAARKSMEEAAGMKDTAVAGALAQTTVQDWSDLGAVKPMRQSVLELPATQPSDLQPQALMPIPDVPVPQGFQPLAPTTSASRPAGPVFRFVGDVSQIRVTNFCRAQMAERGWKTVSDQQQAGGTAMVFTKADRHCSVTIGSYGIMGTEIEIRPGTGAAPMPTTAPATGPAAPTTAPKT
jgi:hypothetical protein